MIFQVASVGGDDWGPDLAGSSAVIGAGGVVVGGVGRAWMACGWPPFFGGLHPGI